MTNSSSRRRTATPGKTTFFISSEADWKKHSDEIVGEEIKVMRRINNRPVAVEAVLTRCGTVVGPFMSELIGYKRLTPSRGGWCGNEMFPEVLTGESRRTATQLVRRLGDRLAKEGYRGFFEVDVLVDTDTGEIYLGELNPRISGASSITNVTAGAYADVPLFLFHILEYMNVDFDLDIDEINERWEELASGDLWSQMVMKETDDIVQRLTAVPSTGQYSLDSSGTLVFRQGRAGLAPAAERGGGVLPEDLRPGRLPLEGRRPRRAGHEGPAAGRLDHGQIGADDPRPPSHRLDPRRVRRYADRQTRSAGHQSGGQVGLSGEAVSAANYSHRHDSRRRHRTRAVGRDSGQLAVRGPTALDVSAHRRVPADRCHLARHRTRRRAAVQPRRAVGHPAVRPDER